MASANSTSKYSKGTGKSTRTKAAAKSGKSAPKPKGGSSYVNKKGKSNKKQDSLAAWKAKQPKSVLDKKKK